MRKICIIGNGRWANRLKIKLDVTYSTNIELIDSYLDIIDVSAYEEVIICIPAYCLLEVLWKIKWGSDKKIVTSCIKWLLDNWEMVCEYLNKNLIDIIKSSVLFLGGANIDDGNEIVDISDDYKLELACVLKNVYAMGFGIALKEWENYAAHKLVDYLNEYKKLWIKEEYWADLFVSSYSDKSRNKMYGKDFVDHKDNIEKTVEWLNTAKIIKKYNLFKDCEEIRKIIEQIWI